MFSNKKQKWSKNRKRLRDALESNVHENQIENLVENFKLLRPDEFETCKGSLLLISIKSGSKECSEFLIENGAICNPNLILFECKYDKIHIVYDLITELTEKYPNSFTQGKFSINKKSLISRLIDPSKVSDNDKRIDYVFDQMGFFGYKEVREVIDENYKSKPEKWSKLISVLREIKLRELGI